MSDIFREVDEEVRRSQAEQMWSRYSGIVLLACVVLVLGVAGYRFFEWQREKAASENGAKFEDALTLIQTGKTAEGEAAIAQIAGTGTGIYKSIAQFRSAADLAKKDAAGAIKAFDALANDATLDAGLRDVARLRSGAVAVDALPLSETEQRLMPLLTPGNVWRHPANELLAASALKAGQLDKARQYLDTIIIDRDAPAPIKARAEILIGLTRGAK
jgi:hypothetical protein